MPPLLRRRDWIAITCALAVVLLLGLLLSTGILAPVDAALLDWLGSRLNAQEHRFLVVVYRLSGVRFTGGLVFIALAYLVIRRWWVDFRFLVMATAGILLLVDSLLKPLFDRARPLDRLVSVDGRSFPSGHAAGSVVFYCSLVAILSLHYPRLRLPLSLLACIWVSLVWLSTLVTRVHWPTDLLAGGALGLAWLTLSLSFWRRWRVGAEQRP